MPEEEPEEPLDFYFASKDEHEDKFQFESFETDTQANKPFSELMTPSTPSSHEQVPANEEPTEDWIHALSNLPSSLPEEPTLQTALPQETAFPDASQPSSSSWPSFEDQARAFEEAFNVPVESVADKEPAFTTENANNEEEPEPFAFSFTEEEAFSHGTLHATFTEDKTPPSFSWGESPRLESHPEHAGQFLDTVNDTLYPQNVLENDGADEQATNESNAFDDKEKFDNDAESIFAEAARYLFPETVVTPSDWTNELITPNENALPEATSAPTEPSYSGVYWPNEEPSPGILDLGESQQKSELSGEFTDLSNLPAEHTEQEVAFTWGEPSLSPVDDPFEVAEKLSARQESLSYDQAEEWTTRFEENDFKAPTSQANETVSFAFPTEDPNAAENDFDFANEFSSSTDFPELPASTADIATSAIVSNAFFPPAATPPLAPEAPGLIIPTTPPPPVSVAKLGRLNIIGVCPLSVDRRLLVVHNGEVFALMVQNGLDEQSSISVLKIFDRNPIAYQSTFTAVPDTRADRQGLYMLQVGSFHGVLSVFKDTVTWYQELS